MKVLTDGDLGYLCDLIRFGRLEVAMDLIAEWRDLPTSNEEGLRGVIVVTGKTWYDLAEAVLQVHHAAQNQVRAGWDSDGEGSFDFIVEGEEVGLLLSPGGVNHEQAG